MNVKELTVSERIDRAVAATECENLMSLHCYYHAGGVHREEIEEFWVKEQPLTWAHNFGQMKGLENYTACYADDQEANAEAYYALLEAVYPEVATVRDRRALTEEAMHLLVSPIIEAAADGKTAKGLWYTPGCIFSTLTPRKEQEGMWIWERYGADFALENGRWLYRNLKVCCDIAGAMDEADWGLSPPMSGPPPGAEGEDGAGAPPPNDGRKASEVNVPGPLHYNLSPTQTPQDRPKMPLPYETFGETHDYAALTGIYEEGGA
jgi:hypothetical protein